MDKPRVFKVKMEYLVTVGHPVSTVEEVRGRIEVRAAEVLFDLRQNQNIDIDVINSVVVIEEVP
jgi:hypothetical protein